MNEALRVSILTVGFAVACGGASIHGTAENGSDGGKGTSACESYANVVFKLHCSTGPLAIQLISQERLLQACENLLKLPGVTITFEKFDTCTTAAEDAGCSQSEAELAACTFRGSLPEGGACNNGYQCQSGKCSASVSGCGTCIRTIAEGASCGDSAACAIGTACESGICTKVTFGSAGAPCDDLAVQCSSGLCDPGTNTCDAYVAPSPAGGACQSNSECATGLCDTPNMKCASVTWTDAGQACFDGTCLTVVPDDQPCDPSAASLTCDPPSNCVNGRCVFPDSVACK